MILRRKELARKALASALQTRVKSGRSLWDPVCVYDLAENLGIEVRFLDVPSMEGLYSKKPGPLILLPAQRPQTRQSYSCAHEIGHHVAGHGPNVDQHIEDDMVKHDIENNSDEFFADRFAGFLLMPKLTVERALTRRGWTPTTLTADQAYVLAGQLGVGYATLLQHMRWSLGILPNQIADTLLKIPPKRIRCAWLGQETTANVLVVDQHWIGRPVDMQIGDYLVVPRGTRIDLPHPKMLEEVTCDKSIFQANHAGIGRLIPPGDAPAIFVRLSRTAYVGLAKYRHLEDCEDAQENCTD